jgi:hypothetical protein
MSNYFGDTINAHIYMDDKLYQRMDGMQSFLQLYYNYYSQLG